MDITLVVKMGTVVFPFLLHPVVEMGTVQTPFPRPPKPYPTSVKITAV